MASMGSIRAARTAGRAAASGEQQTYDLAVGFLTADEALASEFARECSWLTVGDYTGVVLKQPHLPKAPHGAVPHGFAEIRWRRVFR